MDRIYREIIKFSSMLDIEWERLIHRKDLIDLGGYAIRPKCEVLDSGEKIWSLILERKNVASLNNGFIEFYASRGLVQEHSHTNYYMHTDSIILTSLTDKCMSLSTDSYLDREHDILEGCIPYDSTCTPDERKMSVDFTIDNKKLRQMMYNVIDFQALKLKNIDFVVYNFHRGVDMDGDALYNYFTSRPLFRRYRTL